MLNLPSLTPSRIIPTQDQNSITNWKDYLYKSREEFLEKYNRKGVESSSKLGDYELVRTVGTGWFARVILVKNRPSKRYHALKVFRKEAIIKLDQVSHVFNERRIFQSCDFPFITKLEYYFSDNSNIYFIMPFVVGGELFSLLKKSGKLTENTARFYSAQLILVLEYLHNVGVVYRDIKPENILIDKDGYIKLTDFGFAKMLNGRTYTMCGTPEYFAPEMVMNVGYGVSVDWWSLGVLIYEMCCGHSPFALPGRPREHSVFSQIASCSYIVPHYFSEDLKDVVLNLLEREIWKRTHGPKLRQYLWYRPINWLSLINKKIQPPYVPTHTSDYDASNYDLYDEIPLVTSSQHDFGSIFDGF